MLEVDKEAAERTFTEEQVLMLAWAFERSSDGIILTDLNGIIKMANDAFCSMFEYPRDEVVGRRTGFLKSEFSTPEFYRQMWRSLAERGEWKGEIVNRTKFGTEKVCFLTITPILNDQRERVGYLGVEIDLTERKRMEEQIAHAEQLAAIGEAMATLAHEIRNPLNGIRMNAFMLEQARLTGETWSEDDAESITLIKHETQRLQELVNSVLGFARKQELHYERVNAQEYISEVLELVRHEAEEKDIDLRVELADPQYTLRIDPNLMKQVLLNLVQNAMEAAAEDVNSDVRSVLLRCEERPTNDLGLSISGNIVAFDVFNTGRSLSRDQQLKMFKPFFTTKSSGLGLGLAASLKIVRQHGGTILVTSPVDSKAVQPAAPHATRMSVLLPV
jgi:PAS domain S-box-containing protein